MKMVVVSGRRWQGYLGESILDICLFGTPAGNYTVSGFPKGSGPSKPDKLVVHPDHYSPFVQEVATGYGTILANTVPER